MADMLKKLLEGGWIRCPDCGSDDVGFVDQDELPNMWMDRLECKSCGKMVGEMVGHG